MAPSGATTTSSATSPPDQHDHARLRLAEPVSYRLDLCAFGVLDALAEHGIQVPAGMSVAGYDNTPVAALRTVSLTTVDQFATEIGAEAMRSVLARVRGRDRPARHLLVPRGSSSATTAPPPSTVAIRPRGASPADNAPDIFSDGG